MFPALTSEFIKAENAYRHERAHRSFLGRSERASRTRRGGASGGARRSPQPTVDAAAWRARPV